jgi:hypothetical protein
MTETPEPRRIPQALRAHARAVRRRRRREVSSRAGARKPYHAATRVTMKKVTVTLDPAMRKQLNAAIRAPKPVC